MRTRGARAAAFIASIALAAPFDAHGHGLDAHRIDAVLYGSTAEVLATPSSASLRTFDTNGDGLLSRDEVRAQRPAILSALGEQLRVRDEAGRTGVLVRSDVSVPRAGGDEGAPGREHLRFTAVYEWAREPRSVRFGAAFAEGRAVYVSATRAHRDAAGGVLVLDGMPEGAWLMHGASEVTLLRVREAAAPGPVPTVAPRTRTLPLVVAITVGAALVALALTLYARRRRARRAPTASLRTPLDYAEVSS